MSHCERMRIQVVVDWGGLCDDPHHTELLLVFAFCVSSSEQLLASGSVMSRERLGRVVTNYLKRRS